MLKTTLAGPKNKNPKQSGKEIQMENEDEKEPT